MRARPVSIPHLVFGLIFLGAAALWAIGAATDAAAPDLAVAAPAILIGAGAIGLVGIVVNARNARTRGTTSTTTSTTTDEDDSATDTLVIDKEQQQ
jgi:hypothetical protein